MAVVRETWTSLGLLLTLLCFTHQVTSSRQEDSSNYYTAAVVEFTPKSKGGNATITLTENSRAYVEYIKLASQQNADIIVFPEYGLTSLYAPTRRRMNYWATIIPPAYDNYVPCIEERADVSETLKRLSCAARQHHMYVVVNILEKEFCQRNGSSCWDGVNYYNTNVVFDRTGKIVARYRKFNLFGELSLNTTRTPEVVTFDTDFGVTFGTFICFDILFGVPPLNLTRTRGISNFVYTTAWMSEVPFLTAVQTQFGWAFAENVNLLVSGYHEPKNGNAGSGIYLGRKGIANATITSFPKHRMLVSRVPKMIKLTSGVLEDQPHDPTEPRAKPNVRSINKNGAKREADKLDHIYLKHDDLTPYASVPLNVSMREKLCHGDFCCDFDVRTIGAVDSRVVYRAMVFDGLRWHGPYLEAGTRVCALVQCSNDSIHSCGYVEPSNTTFSILSITATYMDYSEILVMPTVLDHTLLPIEYFAYSKRVDAPRTRVNIALNRPTGNLVTFGIYARDFSKDKEHRP